MYGRMVWRTLLNWCKLDTMGSSKVDKSSKATKEAKELKTPKAQAINFPLALLPFFLFTNEGLHVFVILGFCRSRLHLQHLTQSIQTGLALRLSFFKHAQCAYLLFWLPILIVIRLWFLLCRHILLYLHMGLWHQVLKLPLICGEFRY